jgi:hypothetical protein
MKVAATLLIVSLAAGCHTSTAIRPSELPKLSGPPIMPAPYLGEPPPYWPRYVQTPDGHTVEVNRKFDAQILVTNSDTLTFRHPVWAEWSPSHLIVAGENTPPIAFRNDRVGSVEVRQLDVGSTVLVSILGGVAGSALLLAGIASGVGH